MSDDVTFSAKEAVELTQKATPNMTPLIKWCNALIRQQATRGHNMAKDFFVEMKRAHPSQKELTLLIQHYSSPELGFTVECDGKDFKTFVVKWG